MKELLELLVYLALLVLALWLVFSPGPLGKTITPQIHFLLTFRIFPRCYDSIEKKLKQRVIDDELEKRALQFYEEDVKERNLRQRRCALVSAEEPRKVLGTFGEITKDLRRQERKIKKAKKRFWDAWKLAEHFEYEIKEKYADYLPPSLLTTLDSATKSHLATKAHLG